jgi:cell volume regulation protein A
LTSDSLSLINLNGIVSLSLILVSFIIIIGFLGNYQFKRTGVPDILLLILLGFLFGPMMQIVRLEDIASLTPYLADLAMIFILFDGGLVMNLKISLRETPRAMLITVIHLVLCTVAVTFFMMSIGIEPMYGTLFGIMISGNSAAVLIPIVRSIKVSEETVSLITLESTLNNVFQVVSFLTIIGLITVGQLDVLVAAQDIAASFSIGGVIGFIFGFVWLHILLKIKRESFASMLTIAIVFIAYYTTKYLGGSGALCTLLFGIVLGNEKSIFRIIDRKVEEMVFNQYMRHFESEIAFLIRTFFFVYIGLSINITSTIAMVYGTILSMILLGMRTLATYLSTVHSPLKKERKIITVAMSRGLSEAVLSVIFLNYGLPYSTLFQDIAFMVIILTNIMCTIGIYIFTHKTPQETRIEEKIGTPSFY